MSQTLEGVHITALKLVPNERGRLMEVQRSDDPHCPGIGQVYVTQSFNNVVKAWYRHTRQIDQIAVVSGLVKLVLFDGRENARTHGELCEIIFGELAPKLVTIPPGIWHGFQAIGKQDAFLLHMNSAPFDAANPDEERRRPDDPSIPYRW
jgi:dTDP-4-dehydrorhamnose 3,5-epimerase